jgi:hypothetical protein
MFRMGNRARDSRSPHRDDIPSIELPTVIVLNRQRKRNDKGEGGQEQNQEYQASRFLNSDSRTSISGDTSAKWSGVIREKGRKGKEAE